MHLYDTIFKQQEFKKILHEIKGASLVDGTEESDLYFTKSQKEVWFLSDFPKCKPLVQYTWIEFKAPSVIMSNQTGISNWNGPNYWAWLVKYAKEKNQIGFHYFQEKHKECKKGDFAFAFTLIKEGQCRGNDIEFLAEPEVVNSLAAQTAQENLLQEWMPMIHPALMVLCKQNNAAINMQPEILIVNGAPRRR